MSKAIAERQYGIRRRDRHEFTDAELEAQAEVSDNPRTDWIDTLLDDPWTVGAPHSMPITDVMDNEVTLTGSAARHWQQWAAVEARNRAMAAAATEVMGFDTLRAIQDDLRRTYTSPYGPITIRGGEINETIHIR